MKQKDMYTLDELYANLDISLSKLSKIAGITEPTLTRIRDGYSARVETINKLLKAFSQVYGIDLSRDNVAGITLEDKKEIRRQMLARQGHAEKAKNTSVSQPVGPTPQTTAQQPQKRVYSRKKDIVLTDGCILATDFANSHRVNRRTFQDHIKIGLGKGLIHGPDVPEDGSVLMKDYVRTEKRPKPRREHETEYYLTNDQQKAALEFWQRHDVSFAECDDIGCWCHSVKKGEE